MAPLLASLCLSFRAVGVGAGTPCSGALATPQVVNSQNTFTTVLDTWQASQCTGVIHLTGKATGAYSLTAAYLMLGPQNLTIIGSGNPTITAGQATVFQVEQVGSTT
jgi:hypothetical protein